MANRPATCTSCGKRLSKKQWYYRNGQYFCKPRCWDTLKSKVQSEGAKPAEAAAPEAARPAVKAAKPEKSEAPAKQ